MTGRGIDQILPHPLDPRLFEGWLTSSVDYVRLAERRWGALPRQVPFDYVWGDALELWRTTDPDLRIGNLETSVTFADAPAPKGINYRMSPQNVGVLTAAQFDCCPLANNHVLDWGRVGLIETLETLRRAGIATAGAGRDLVEASTPAMLKAR